ncbi:MAG: transposase, partial [Selenomonas bovis]|nr:transposase [Selenomonas bovis]
TIAANVSDQVEQFHKRPVAKRYAVIFCDAMYVNLRRDSVAKESIHVLLGITPEGHKEILDYAILPSESALNYADLLKSLKTRGHRYCSSSRTALSVSQTQYRTSSRVPGIRVAGFISCVL